MDELRPGLAGIDVDTTIFRPATFIEQAIDNLTRALLLGCLLVILILGAFLFEWRTALISLVAIPLSLVAAGLVLTGPAPRSTRWCSPGWWSPWAWWSTTRSSTWRTSCAGCARTARRRDAVDGTGHPRRLARGARRDHLRHGHHAGRGRAGVLHRRALGLVLPSAGRCLRARGGRVAGRRAHRDAGAGLDPAAARALERRSPRWSGRSSAATRPCWPGSVRSPKPAYAMVGVIVALGAAVAAAARPVAAPVVQGTRLPDALAAASPGPRGTRRWSGSPSDVSTELRAIPGVRNFGAHIGQALLADEASASTSPRTGSASTPTSTTTPPSPRSRRWSTATRACNATCRPTSRSGSRRCSPGPATPIVVRIFGPDLHGAAREGGGGQARDGGRPGNVDVKAERLLDIPQVQVTVDLGRRAAVRAQARRRPPGDGHRHLRGGGRRHLPRRPDLRRAGLEHPSTRTDLDAIRAMPIDTPSGEQVRLGEWPRSRSEPTPNAVRAREHLRRIDVTANVHGRDLGSVARDVEATVAGDPVRAGVPPRGPRRVRGTAGRLARGCWLRGLAAVVILLLLITLVPEPRLAVLVRDPALRAGRRGARGVAGRRRAVARVAGRVPRRAGIAARNGIMLISHFRHLEAHEGEAFGPELVLRGARERLAPILMTTLATGLALVPLVVAGSVPGQRDRVPDGGGDPRRAGHLDAAEPVRGSVAVPAVRSARRPRSRSDVPAGLLHTSSATP